MLFSLTKRLEAEMAAAESYDEWKKAAIAHDKATKTDKWIKSDVSKYFDYGSIRTRLNRLQRQRRKGDHEGLLFSLNEGLHGNIDGMGHARLFGKAKYGTKKLITAYVEEVARSLDVLASDAANDIPLETRLDFFRRAQHCYGCTALMMSGAGSLLYFHMGVVKALAQERLLPSILSGSSGGAIVGSLVSTHGDEELERIFDPENLVHEIERDQGILGRLLEFAPEVASTEEVKEVLERLIPDLTFLEALERSGRHLNVSIAAAEKHQTSRLLNAYTTPNVFVREAVMASAAIPGFFPPVTLCAKNDRGERQAYLASRKWVDGSISDDLPAKRLARVYGVNHFIVSQVNPHIFPFMTGADGEKKTVMTTVKSVARATAREWINAGVSLVEKPLSLSSRASRIANFALGIINQDYVGDINILPDRRLFNPLKLLAHRSLDEVIDLMEMGERAAWPKIEQIRVQTLIGRKLNHILSEMDDSLLQVASDITRRAS